MKTIVIEALSALRGGGQTYLLNLMKNIPPEWMGNHRIVLVVSEEFAKCIISNIPVDILVSKFPNRSLIHQVSSG